jgi:hypothetical protein
VMFSGVRRLQGQGSRGRWRAADCGRSCAGRTGWSGTSRGRRSGGGPACTPTLGRHARSALAHHRALPAWPASTLEFMVLGPAHEACRRYLAGAPVDLAGLRRPLSDVAWTSVSAFAGGASPGEPTAL